MARRLLSSAFLPLLALASTSLLVGVLLAVTPLNELPDTYCQRLVSPPGGSGCDAVTARRLHWVIVVAVVALLAIALTVAAARSRRSAYRGSASPHDRVRRGVNRRIAAAVLTLVAVELAMVGAAFLTVGLEHDTCGSTLSRVDPEGSYSPDRPIFCAPSYARSRAAAWWAGGLAVTALAGATALDHSARGQRDRELPRRPAQN